MPKKNAIGHALSLLNRVSRSPLLDKLHARELFDNTVYAGSRGLFQTGTTLRKRFKPLLNLSRPARLSTQKPPQLFDLTLSDEQNMFVDELQRMASEALRPAAEQADESGFTAPELLASINDLGLLQMAIPEAAGGAGEADNSILNMLAAEHLAQGDMSIALASLSTLGVANTLTRYGDSTQQSHYLAALALDNPPVACLAINEPQVLFDPFQLSSTAEATDDGYRITFDKTLVAMGMDADLIIVSAQLEGEGPCLFCVEADDPKLTRTVAPAMGLRAAAMVNLSGKQIQLPAHARLGDADSYHDFISRNRIAWAALTCGCAQAVLDYVIPYVKERKAFGEPIAHRQAVAFMVANIGIELEGLRLLTWRAASRAEQGLPFHREAWLAQQQAAEMGMRIGSDGVQLLGGHGFIKDHPVERWYRDLRAAAIGYGGLIV